MSPLLPIMNLPNLQMISEMMSKQSLGQQFKVHRDFVMGYTDVVASHSASASFAVRVRRRTVRLRV